MPAGHLKGIGRLRKTGNWERRESVGGGKGGKESSRTNRRRKGLLVLPQQWEGKRSPEERTWAKSSRQLGARRERDSATRASWKVKGGAFMESKGQRRKEQSEKRRKKSGGTPFHKRIQFIQRTGERGSAEKYCHCKSKNNPRLGKGRKYIKRTTPRGVKID